MTMSSWYRAHHLGAAMHYEQSGRLRLKFLVRTGCTYALAAALIVGLTNPSLAGKRHRHHSGHGHHHHSYAAVAVLGFGMLNFMLSRPRVDHYWQERWIPPMVYRQPPIVYVVPHARDIVRSTPPPAAAHVRQRAALPSGCLMIREYQTRIIIGGKEVEAYGDACMQPDGFWRRGPPKMMRR